MKRTFIYLPNFDKSWGDMGLSDNNLIELESTILEQPDKGELIPGTGGLRKIRAGKDHKGKSGGIRVKRVKM